MSEIDRKRSRDGRTRSDCGKRWRSVAIHHVARPAPTFFDASARTRPRWATMGQNGPWPSPRVRLAPSEPD